MPWVIVQVDVGRVMSTVTVSYEVPSGRINKLSLSSAHILSKETKKSIINAIVIHLHHSFTGKTYFPLQHKFSSE